jgi:putative chitinase
MDRIEKFQKENGLVSDGILGKNTFSKMKSVWKIKLNSQLANYLGQVDHETGGFKGGLENLRYSVDRMLIVFKNDFDTNKDRTLSEEEKKKTLSLVGHPDKIANFVYANQNGNGNEASGDGWRYIGAGGLQLTGKRNYELFAKWMGLSKTPTKEEIVDKYYWEVGLFYFKTNNLWKIAEKTDLESITRLSKAINRGNPDSKYLPNGLQDRIERTQHYDKIIK